jgi:hypothetical protein
MDKKLLVNLTVLYNSSAFERRLNCYGNFCGKEDEYEEKTGYNNNTAHTHGSVK